jgi:hypothetical protein
VENAGAGSCAAQSSSVEGVNGGVDLLKILQAQRDRCVGGRAGGRALLCVCVCVHARPPTGRDVTWRGPFGLAWSIRYKQRVRVLEAEAEGAGREAGRLRVQTEQLRKDNVAMYGE